MGVINNSQTSVRGWKLRNFMTTLLTTLTDFYGVRPGTAEFSLPIDTIREALGCLYEQFNRPTALQFSVLANDSLMNCELSNFPLR